MNSAPARRVVPFVSLCCIALCAPVSARSQDEGEKIFKQTCFVCHTINQGTLIGPDLAGVQTRRPLDWIIRFVQSSQSVIGSGDTYAVELFEKHNKVPMPDNNLSDAQIRSVIAYITANSAAAGDGVGAVEAMAPPRVATDEDVRAGEAIFVGARRLAGGGPTCISCHGLKYDRVMAGGALARDLTDAHSRLGGPGLTSIIGNAPFPVMRQAFADKPITEDEAFMLAAFLQHVDSVRDTQHTRHYGARLFLSGLGGAFLVIGLLSGAWFRVKKRSVNHAIYRRQIRSTWEPRNDSGRGGPR